MRSNAKSNSGKYYSDESASLKARIAELEQQLDTIKESEKQSDLFFENTTIGLYRTTPDGRILAVNPALLSMLGYKSIDDFAQRNLNEAGYAPDYNRSAFLELIEDEGQIIGLESAWYRHDGTTLFIRENAKAVRNNSGETLYFEGTVEDITKREQAEAQRKDAVEALRESEKLLRTIAENYPNSYVVIIEEDFTIGFTSGQEFKKQNLDPEQFVGLGLEQVYADQTAFVKKYYEKTFKGEECTFELFMNDKYQLNRTVPLPSEDGSIPRILVVVENITQRKQAEEALERARAREILHQAQIMHTDRLRTVGQLAAGVAHEINNPLSVLYGTLQSVRAGMALDFSDDPEMVERTLRVTRRIKDIVNSLLAFSRQQPSERILHNVNDVLKDVLILVTSRLRKDGIEVDLHVTESLGGISINRAQIQQVFLNIIFNAQDAMQKEGKLTISTEIKGDYVVVSFTDTGCGIAQENLSNIFTPFHRTEEISKGTGLGLSISHGIIQEHNGRIDVDSKVGEGTTMKVLLPVRIKPKRREGKNANDSPDH